MFTTTTISPQLYTSLLVLPHGNGYNSHPWIFLLYYSNLHELSSVEKLQLKYDDDDDVDVDDSDSDNDSNNT